MRKVLVGKLFLISVTLLSLSGCFFDDNNSGDNDPNALNVAGNWQATVHVDNCTPAAVCSAYGFQQGLTVTAVMNLSQNGSNVQGTYSYQGAPINAEVTGRVTGSQLTLNGVVNDILGRATVSFVGAVSGNVIDAAVSHEVSVTGGPTGNVNGSGDFVRN